MRPILMTSFAFIMGSIPLAIASGAGANARVSMGTVVIGGLIVATFITLFITPTFYVAFERLFGPDKHAAEANLGKEGGVQPAE
jgi:multidrug efflux pump subunit AcrB